MSIYFGGKGVKMYEIRNVIDTTFGRRTKFLIKFHFLDYVRKDTKLRKHRQFIYRITS